MPTRHLTVEEILNGTGLGRMQSAGHMSVIPILDDGDAQDDTFAPPDFNASTNSYGTVDVENRDQERPTIVPGGAGWVTEEHAQDHATPSTKLIKAGGRDVIKQACCIQESQGGLISHSQMDFVVLPVPIRVQALATRKEENYSRLWPAIRSFKTAIGTSGSGNLVDILKRFEKELDEFVAQFELVPNQIGAVIMIGDTVVGVERAPTIEFWKRMWEPLIRVCYGSLALKAARKLGNALPAHRVGLNVKHKSLAGIKSALGEANAEVKGVTDATVRAIGATELQAAADADQKLGGYKVVTVGSPQLSGQLVAKSSAKIPYASLFASGA